MIAPRPSAIVVYLVLLALVVAAIVVLLRWSHQLEEGPRRDIVRNSPPVDGGAPYSDEMPLRYGLEYLSGDSFQFAPYTVPPRCVAQCEVDNVLRHIPADERNGLACQSVIGLRINTEGRVTATDILRSSGNDVCDRAVEAWARTTRWTTAYNRDQPVTVWIAHPVDISGAQ